MHRWLLLSVLILLIDQITKIWVKMNFRLYERFSILSGFFDLTLIYNTGVAFSFLDNNKNWQRWFFIVFTITVIIILLFWMNKIKSVQLLHRASLALIIGGAIGNLIDRIWHGYVVDFLLLYYKQWFYPAFNIADSAIVLGFLLLLISEYYSKNIH